MVPQEKRILCDIREPNKNHLWLRPRINKDGYDLLYYGANGWTPLIDCCCPSAEKIDSSNVIQGVTGNCK